MNEINLNLKTIKIPNETSYTIDDLERLFGKRIKKAIHSETSKDGTIYKAIIGKKMSKICKPWKFWNKDIRRAYKKYIGYIIVPWTIEQGVPQIVGLDSIDKNLLKTEINSRYGYKTF